MFIHLAPLLVGLEIIAGSLVDQLGSEVFAERVVAQRQVEALGRFAQSALLCGLGSGDLETQRRCERALCKLDNFGLMRIPRIDALPMPQRELDIGVRQGMIQSMISYARLEVKGKIAKSEDEAHRVATVLYCEWCIERGASRSEIRKLLLQMQDTEEKR